MAGGFSIWQRRLHRWGAIAIAAPLLLVIVTGILLQVKKQVAWIQPPERRGTAAAPAIPFAKILDAARAVPEAAVRTWDDVDRLDVRPGKGVVKVQARSRWEIQLDARTGAVLQVAYRRSDVIEALHDGSFFGSGAKLGIFLPSGVVLFVLWMTGIYLWLLPYLMKRKRARLQSRLKAEG